VISADTMGDTPTAAWYWVEVRYLGRPTEHGYCRQGSVHPGVMRAGRLLHARSAVAEQRT